MEGTLAQEMSNPNQNIDPLYGNRLERGDQRGNPNNKKDWYSFAGITLSFTLNNDTKGCNPSSNLHLKWPNNRPTQFATTYCHYYDGMEDGQNQEENLEFLAIEME